MSDGNYRIVKPVQKLDCARCGAANTFYVYPDDEDVGFCVAEELFWTIRVVDGFKEKLESKVKSVPHHALYYKTIRAAQEVVDKFIAPGALISEQGTLRKLFDILNDQGLVRTMNTDTSVLNIIDDEILKFGFINQLGDEILVEQYEQPLSVSKEKAIHHAHYINTRKNMRTFFLLSGELNCGITCTECTPDAHHWIYSSEDVYECKHCAAWRTLTNKDEVE